MAGKLVAFLLGRMDRTFRTGGWAVPLVRAVHGVGTVQAAWPGPDDPDRDRPGGKGRDQPNVHTIWQLVNRATFWKEVCAAVSACTDTDLHVPLPDERTPVGELLAALAEHDAYHAGQILILRRLQGAWQDET